MSVVKAKVMRNSKKCVIIILYVIFLGPSQILPDAHCRYAARSYVRPSVCPPLFRTITCFALLGCIFRTKAVGSLSIIPLYETKTRLMVDGYRLKSCSHREQGL